MVTLNSERSQPLLEEETPLSLAGTLLIFHQSPLRLLSVSDSLIGLVLDIRQLTSGFKFQWIFSQINPKTCYMYLFVRDRGRWGEGRDTKMTKTQRLLPQGQRLYSPEKRSSSIVQQ